MYFYARKKALEWLITTSLLTRTPWYTPVVSRPKRDVYAYLFTGCGGTDTPERFPTGTMGSHEPLWRRAHASSVLLCEMALEAEEQFDRGKKLGRHWPRLKMAR